MKKTAFYALFLFLASYSFGLNTQIVPASVTPPVSPAMITAPAASLPEALTTTALSPAGVTIPATSNLTFTAAAPAAITAAASAAVSGTAAPVAATAQTPQVFYLWVPYSPELTPAPSFYGPSGLSQTPNGVSATAMNVSGTALAVSPTATGVSGTAASVSGTAVNVSFTAENTDQNWTDKSKTPEGISITAYDGGNVIYAFSTGIADTVKLFWEPKNKEASFKYNIYRTTAVRYEKINPRQITLTAYADSGITSLTAYSYEIESIDEKGASYMSVTFTVKTPPINFPQMPSGFKAFQDIEAVTLKWSFGGQGSFPVSGYNIYRGKLSDKLDFCKFVPAAKNVYTDNDVVPALRYYYSISAVDIRGHESDQVTAPGVMPFPPPRTNLCIMPTAYRNNIFNNNGFNVDCGFAYYIGTLYGEHNVAVLGEGNDTFKKNGVWLLSVDAKYTYFSGFENWWPALGAGVMYSLLMQDSIGGSTSNYQQGVGTSFSTKSSIIGLQGLYLVATKNIGWDFTGDLGYVFGFKMYKGDQGEGLGGYIPYLVSSVLGGGSDLTKDANTNYDSKNVYYLGFSRPLFGKASVKVEFMVPVEMNDRAYMPSTYIINTHIDRLLNFDIAYMHYSGGFAWLGYYNLRFSVFPSPYK
jgi:hypothetical protein